MLTDTTPIQFIVDSAGTRTHVIISVEQFTELISRQSMDQGLPAVAATEEASICSETDRPTDIPDLEPAVEEELFTFALPKKGGDAKGHWRYPTMVVLKGSTIADNPTPKMPPRYYGLRDRLISTGVIARIAGEWGELTFTRNYRFNSASEAACVIEGGSRDGYRSWKDRAGHTLSDLGFSK